MPLLSARSPPALDTPFLEQRFERPAPFVRLRRVRSAPRLRRSPPPTFRTFVRRLQALTLEIVLALRAEPSAQHRLVAPAYDEVQGSSEQNRRQEHAVDDCNRRLAMPSSVDAPVVGFEPSIPPRVWHLMPESKNPLRQFLLNRILLTQDRTARSAAESRERSDQ